MPNMRKSRKIESATLTKSVQAHRVGYRSSTFSINGNEYFGEFQEDRRHGFGSLIIKHPPSIYTGEWRNDKPTGDGSLSILPPGAKKYKRVYHGGWFNGKKQGYGIYYYKGTEEMYEGDWEGNHRTGWGRMYYANGDIYEGEWYNDKYEGRGILRLANGNWYEGGWKDGKKDGDGKHFYVEKSVVYEGFWVDGIPKCGTVHEFKQEESTKPMEHPIPEVKLVDPDTIMRTSRVMFGGSPTPPPSESKPGPSGVK